jgi:hypothetical protein
LNITTRDDLKLVGKLFYLSSWESKVPAIIMMHGHTLSENPWEEGSVMDTFIQNGYACMTFMFRGHGMSVPGFDQDLLVGEDAIYYVGCDVEAAINALRNEPMVDISAIGLMGGSLGAGAATFCNHFPEVKASVPLSTVRAPGNKTFADFFPDIDAKPLQTIYYITPENDIVGEHILRDYAKYWFDQTREPRKLWIIEGSSLHGHTVAGYPGVLDSMTAWFVEHMPSPALQ